MAMVHPHFFESTLQAIDQRYVNLSFGGMESLLLASDCDGSAGGDKWPAI
jgi:hypothetical protein